MIVREALEKLWRRCAPGINSSQSRSSCDAYDRVSQARPSSCLVYGEKHTAEGQREIGGDFRKVDHYHFLRCGRVLFLSSVLANSGSI